MDFVEDTNKFYFRDNLIVSSHGRYFILGLLVVSVPEIIDNLADLHENSYAKLIGPVTWLDRSYNRVAGMHFCF